MSKNKKNIKTSYLLKREEHFNNLKSAILKKHGRYLGFCNEEPKEYPAIAIVKPYYVGFDAHFSDMTMYDVEYVYLSDFENNNKIFQPTTKL